MFYSNSYSLRQNSMNTYISGNSFVVLPNYMISFTLGYSSSTCGICEREKQSKANLSSKQGGEITLRP